MHPFLSYEDAPLCASLILPSLYLSDVYTATSPTIFSNLGITHIVSVVATPRHDYPVIQALEILHIQLDDSMHAKLEEYFDSTSAWIQDALTNGESKVLVHCVVGASRSPTIVIAYLMAKKGMSYETALAPVHERRSVVWPNVGFVQQLKGLERRLNNTDTEGKVVERQGLHSTIS